MGLEGQPRAVIFHEKYGREHAHVVWSRIDDRALKAVHISHDKQKLRTICREFARDYGIELPKGMQQDQGHDRNQEQSKSQAEMQQQARTGISKEERQETLTKAWQRSDTGASFVQAMEQEGYYLAKGDKKNTYVVVDMHGDVHGLARQIKGVRKKELHERLKDYPLEKVPDIAAAKSFAKQRQHARQDRLKDKFKMNMVIQLKSLRLTLSTVKLSIVNCLRRGASRNVIFIATCRLAKNGAKTRNCALSSQ